MRKHNNAWEDAGMSTQTRRRSGAAFALIIGMPLLFVAAAVWWLESRFGAGVALTIVGGLAGVACVVVGYTLSMANTRYTLHTATQFNADLASVERTRAQTQRAELGIYREYARGEREAFGHRAKLEVANQQEVKRLARQQAKALVDAQRAADQQRQSRTWTAYDNAETVDGDFRMFE